MNVCGLQTKGVSSVELLVGVSIAALILISASYTISMFMSTAQGVTEKTQALYLAEDGMELVRFVRDNDWANISALTVGTPYYLAVTGSSVALGTTPETIGSFSREVIVQNVYRDATTADIVASTTPGSVADPKAKYITVTVTWDTPTKTVSLDSILADLIP